MWLRLALASGVACAPQVSEDPPEPATYSDALADADVTGPAGPVGLPGLSCWDLDGDGAEDLYEDVNLDGIHDALDCDGAVGAPGDAGATGPAGPAGSQGPTGPAGPEGAAGLQGSMGPDGATGPEGPAGFVGPEGTEGAMGPEGSEGQQGPEGPVGAIGPEGPVGANGVNCYDHGVDINADGLLTIDDCVSPLALDSDLLDGYDSSEFLRWDTPGLLPELDVTGAVVATWLVARAETPEVDLSLHNTGPGGSSWLLRSTNENSGYGAEALALQHNGDWAALIVQADSSMQLNGPLTANAGISSQPWVDAPDKLVLSGDGSPSRTSSATPRRRNGGSC